MGEGERDNDQGLKDIDHEIKCSELDHTRGEIRAMFLRNPGRTGAAPAASAIRPRSRSS